jgi:hypothetical protein
MKGNFESNVTFQNKTGGKFFWLCPILLEVAKDEFETKETNACKEDAGQNLAQNPFSGLEEVRSVGKPEEGLTENVKDQIFESN